MQQIYRSIPCRSAISIKLQSARHERHECDTSDTSATRATLMRHEWHKCDTSERRATRVLHERHECNTSEKPLILITPRIKTYFHIPIFTIWQVKDYKERNNFILSTTFRNASFPCQNEFEKCTTKTGICNGKSYIRELYTRL